ncbi:MAG: DUF1501 domain-containing protein [Luteibaculum sp.]
MMKRRDFLKTTAGGALSSFMLQGIPVQSMANSKLLQLLADEECEDRILVLIQLNGGNDGLHTLIPLDQYDKLQLARPNFVYPENQALPLLGVNDLALHGSMTHLRNLYADGKLTLVQNVGYPNQNFSHFRSTDIWLTASDEDEVLDTGWLGRTMDCKHPDYPTNYPNEDFPDPIGIQTGVFVSPGFLGQNASYGYAIDDPDNFYQLIDDTDNTPTDTPYGHELSFIRQTARQSNAYSQIIVEAAGKQNNLSDLYPAARQNSLADQLKIVARMIGGGLKTRIYMVSLGGFDTHANQIEPGSPTEGLHGELLFKVSEAMNAFQDDIEKMGVSNKVLSMTFSEFGRRIASNGSYGTDHGSAAPLFIMSSGIEGSIIGNNPVIPNTVGPQDNLDMEIDFRSVYATVLRDWFCIPEDKIREILFGDFDILPLQTTGVKSYDSSLAQIKLFPNPAQNDVFIENDGQAYKLEIFDARGMRVKGPLKFSGNNLQPIDVSPLKSGSYHVKLQNASGYRVMQMIKI